jgi:hypothetical protein
MSSPLLEPQTLYLCELNTGLSIIFERPRLALIPLLFLPRKRQTAFSAWFTRRVR